MPCLGRSAPAAPAPAAGSTGGSGRDHRQHPDDPPARPQPQGPPLRASVPFGPWKTQTFIAGLRCHELRAPWIIDGPITRSAFDTYVETQRAPTLRDGDGVIPDNLAVHKSQKAAPWLKRRGAWFLFLPASAPDLNPIEQALSKLKAHLRTAEVRTCEALWRAGGDICNLFEPPEGWNSLKAAGYASD